MAETAVRFGRRAPLLFLGAVALLLLPLAYQVAHPFFAPVAAAGVLAIVMNPVHLRISRWIGRPGAAALVSTILTVLVVLLPLIWVGVTLTGELNVAYQELSRKSAEEGGLIALFTHWTDPALDLFQRLNIDREALKTDLVARLRGLTGAALSSIGSAAGALTSSLLTAVLAFVIVFFFFREGPAWMSRFRAMLPLKTELTERLMTTLGDTIVANVHGVLIVALGQGFLLGIGFWILGLPSPATWGTIGAVCSMIPIVGILLVWIPFVIVLLLKGAYWKAVILTLWNSLLVGSFDNIVRPLVVSGRVKQHPLLVAFSVLGGVQAFGAAGLLVGPVVISLLIAVIETIRALTAESSESLSWLSEKS